METRAPYALVGLFMLTAIAAVFGFIYWLHNTGGMGEKAAYRIRFDGSVSGLLPGAPVLFNGIRVGEVSDLQLGSSPREVMARIEVNAGTPIRADTQAGLEFQGLTGVAVVTLAGGTSTVPPVTDTSGQPPVIAAAPEAGLSLSQAARQVLRRVDGMLVDNADGLRETITNLNTFSAALARNSERLDGIVAGLERMTGGGATPPRVAVFEMSAPSKFPPLAREPTGQMVIADPTALLALDTQKILVRPNPPDGSGFAHAQWSDSIPKLLQETLIQSFENAKLQRLVSRPMPGLKVTHQLLIDIRTFQLSLVPSPLGEVEFSAKILDSGGTIVDARVFHASAPAKAVEPASAAEAINEAFGKAATELVIWASKTI